MKILKELRQKIKTSKSRVFTKQELYYMLDTFDMCEDVRYTENDMISFARVYTEGSYDLYRDCKTVESKLEKYNSIKLLKHE